MPPRDPLTYPKGIMKLDTLGQALKESTKRPPTLYTQGGSSRKNSGAKVAATNGLARRSKKKGPF